MYIPKRPKRAALAAMLIRTAYQQTLKAAHQGSPAKVRGGCYKNIIFALLKTGWVEISRINRKGKSEILKV